MAKRLFGERLGKDLSQVLQLENSRTFSFISKNLKIYISRTLTDKTHYP